MYYCLSKNVANLTSNMYKLLFLVTLFFVLSCKSDDNTVQDNTVQDHSKNDIDSTDAVVDDSSDTIEIISDYDLDVVDPKNRAEFIENLAKIEDEHGAQWDFCRCAVKNDSINRAFQQPNLPDNEFDRLFDRSNVIEQRCQAFLVQNPSTTPDERAAHTKKIRDCLKAAGVK